MQAILLLHGIEQRFRTVHTKLIVLKFSNNIFAHIGSDSGELDGWIIRKYRRDVISIHGGKSNAREVRSCSACNGFTAVVDTTSITVMRRRFYLSARDLGGI